jgi:uncharacterized protein (DUF433 family)
MALPIDFPRKSGALKPALRAAQVNASALAGPSISPRRRDPPGGILICSTTEVPELEHRMDKPELLSRITVDPDQCGGRSCIRGMRIRVIDVLEVLAAGESAEDILAEYPYLESDDIAASLLYAARQLDHPVVAA